MPIKLTPLPPQAELHRRYIYEPDSGLVICILKQKGSKNYMRPIGSINEHGYVRIKVGDTMYMAHRVIWKWVYGTEPSEVDHVNGIRSDNRLCNLRVATRSQNCANAKRRKIHIVGKKSVVKHGNRYQSVITKDGIAYCLGSFATAEKAHAAYIKKAIELFGEFANAG